MSAEQTRQTKWVTNAIASAAFIVMWAFLTYFLTLSLIGPALNELITGNIDGMFEQVGGYFTVFLIFTILSIPFYLFFWLLVLIYRYANSMPLLGIRHKPAEGTIQYSKSSRVLCTVLGVTIGLLVYLLQGFA